MTGDSSEDTIKNLYRGLSRVILMQILVGIHRNGGRKWRVDSHVSQIGKKIRKESGPIILTLDLVCNPYLLCLPNTQE